MAAPGWYPDPNGRAEQRWWDGSRWHGWVVREGRVQPDSPAAGVQPDNLAAGVQPDNLGAGVSAAGDERAPFPLRSAWWALGGFVVATVLSAVFGTLAAVGTGVATLALIGSFVGVWVALGGTCVLVSRRYGSGHLWRDLGFRVVPGDIGWGLLTLVGALVAVSVVSSVLVRFPRLQGSNVEEILGRSRTVPYLVVATVAGAVGAPVFEELFFRGFLQRALGRRLPVAVAVVVTALLFGVVHVQPDQGWGNVGIVAGVAAIGLALGTAAARSKRLGPSLIGHGAFNLVVTLVNLAARTHR